MVNAFSKKSAFQLMVRRLMCPLLLMSALLVHAASDDHRFTTFSHGQGLSQSVVICLFQDSRGFLWMGTQDGLNRFDGYRFVTYRQNRLDDNSLSDNYIRNIIEDGDGRLWIGTQNGGLNSFNPRTHTFTRYPIADERRDGTLSAAVRQVTLDSRNRLWIATSRGLSYLSPDRERFHHYRHDPDNPRTLPGASIRAVVEDPAEPGVVWVSTGAGLVNIRDDHLTVYRHDPNDPGSLGEDNIFQLYFDRDGRLWVATSNRGVSVWDRAGRRFSHYLHDPDDRNSLIDNSVWSFHQDREGDMWIGTTGGLNRLQPVTGRITRYLENQNNPGTLGPSTIMTITEDQSGLIWAGAFGNGAVRFNRHLERFHHINQEKSGLSNNQVWALAKTGDGRLWVGADKGLNRFGPNGVLEKIYVQDPNHDNGLMHNRICSLYVDRAGVLWVGSNRRGIHRYHPDEDRFEAVDVGDTLALSDQIYAFHEDLDGGFWLGALRAGLIKLDRKTLAVDHYAANHNESALTRDAVRAIIDDTSNRDLLWIGSYEGLFRLDRRTGTFTRFTDHPDEGGLSHKVVSCLIEDHDQTNLLWVGGNGGLNRFHKHNGVERIYDRNDGMVNDTILGLLEDRRRRIWISTNKGLAVLDQDADTLRTYDHLDGLQSDEFSAGACFKDDEGRFYFGGINGFNAFHPAEIIDSDYIPPIRFTDFLLYNRSVPLQNQDPDSPLERPLRSGDHITLKPGQDMVTFEFSALDFARPEKNRYAYRLSGFDADWIETQADKRFAVYAKLDPGVYRFHVKGTNKDGVWNQDGAHVDLEVLPPLWRTWWAKTFYWLTLFSLIAVYLRIQRDKLAHERAIAERDRQIADQERRTAEELRKIDKLKDEFLANTSHELRTPLNGIIGLTESLIEGAAGEVSPMMNTHLKMISASGRRLSNLVNDILDFSKLRNQNLSLELKPVDIRALTDVVLTLTRPLLGGKTLILENLIPAEAPAVLADENRLQQIMHNLVGNAVKFTESGNVTVSAVVGPKMLTVSVTDTGIGIPKDKAAIIFEVFGQADGGTTRGHGGAGLGLAVTHELVQLHGGSIWVESELGVGSTFSYTLPITRAPAGAASESQPVARVNDFDEIQAHLPKAGSGDGSFSILIVDDEPINRQVLINHLSLHRYRVTEVSSGMEALRVVDDGQLFDLVLLDIMMPGMSGYEVCEELRRRFSVQDLPIIFLSAKNQAGDLRAGFDAGANDYLTKPVSKTELISRVRTHLQLLDINRNLERKVSDRTQELNLKNQELNAKNEELETLDRIVRVVNREVDLDSVFQSLLEQGLVLFPKAEKGILLLLDRSSGDYLCKSHVGLANESLDGLRLTAAEVRGRYMERGETLGEGIFLICASEDLPAAEKFTHTPFTSMVAMSLSRRDRLEGFLVWDNRDRVETFDRTVADKLSRLREHAISAVYKARLLKELQSKNDEILRTQNQLIMQEKMASMGSLTSGVAHELKNPLNFINNFAETSIEIMEELAELLRDKPGQSEAEVGELLRELREGARRIHEHGRRADGIVESMMAFAHETTSAAPAGINSLVREFAAIAWRSAWGESEPLGELILDLDPKVGELSVVARDLSRVVVNLVDNSVEALMEKRRGQADFQPKLRVVTVDGADHVAIIVRDNGPGFTAEEKQRMLEPFYTTKVTGSGHIGLGLSISCDIIVQEHGGRLLLDSKPGEYAEMTILLPK